RQRIGKREWHIYIGEAVVVVSSIQQIIGGVAGATGDGDGLGTEEAFTAGVGPIALIDRRARDRNQFCRIAAVEGQGEDALLIDDLGNRILLRLHQAGVEGDLDSFRHGAYVHGYVDLNVIADSEEDSRLHVRLKPWRSRLERVSADRQVGNGVDTLGVGHGL